MKIYEYQYTTDNGHQMCNEVTATNYRDALKKARHQSSGKDLIVRLCRDPK